MVTIKRESPVRMNATPLKSELRDNWNVALSYENEGGGPWLVDLAHKIRWDLQAQNIGDLDVVGYRVPTEPGRCTFGTGMLLSRMNRTQASVYHLGACAPDMPGFPGATDVSEATVFLALFGPKTFLVTEKLTNLDFQNPANTAPFLLQGPFCHVPCQIVTLEKAPDHSGGILLTCSRGYGDSMVAAILKAGEEFGLRPAGENRFNSWVEEILSGNA